MMGGRNHGTRRGKCPLEKLLVDVERGVFSDDTGRNGQGGLTNVGVFGTGYVLFVEDTS